VVNKERREQLSKQIGPAFELKLKKAGSVREIATNDFAIEQLDTKDVPTFDRTINIKERTVEMKVKTSSSAGIIASLGSSKGTEKSSLLGTMKDPESLDKTQEEK
jgi:hypothetical protein